MFILIDTNEKIYEVCRTGGIYIKFSDYNIFLPHTGDVNSKVIYNTRTGATAAVGCEYLEESETQFRKYILTSKDSKSKELVELLKKGEFLVSKKVDEKKLIHLQYLKTKFSTSSLDLTVIPTLRCNFACAYCYEKDLIDQGYINSENQEMLLNFVKEQSPFISNLHLTWYGGEPLLALSIIEKLTEGILSICSKHNIEYSSSIITNGYLLTEETLNVLNRCLVKDIQISIDGMAETHDIRRPLINSKVGTFNRIIQNLVDNKDLLPEKVRLRINVDEDNTDEAYKLVEFLMRKDLTRYVTPYLGKVDNINDCYFDSICLSESKYAESAIKFASKVHPSLFDIHPRPIYNFCGADSTNSYTVNFDGSLFKCWEDWTYVNKVDTFSRINFMQPS